MSIVDARELDRSVVLDSDICVVGAGAAGTTIAAELDGSSRSVCLIESGGVSPDEETQSLYDLENTGYPIRENFMSRARYFGGSCNLWAGRSMILDEIDIGHRSWVPHSGWPISFSELNGYYQRGAEILGLPSLERFQENAYCKEMTHDEQCLYGRGPLEPKISLWAKRPKRFGKSNKSRLRKSSNVRLILNASVTKINLHRDGSAVESINASTLNHSSMTVRAKVFVLACGGLENARLLLVSRDVHSEGVGNQWDVVGRYYMDHPRAVFGTVRFRENSRLPLLRGLPLRDGKVQFGIGFSQDTQRREELLNHYVTFEAQFSDYVEQSYESFVQSMKVLMRKGYAGSRWRLGHTDLGQVPGMIYLITPKELTPHFLYRWYVTIRNAVHPHAGGNKRVIVYFCEQPPDPESRVTLSSERDRLGMNRLALHWRIGPEIERSVLRLQALLHDRLERKGIGKVENAAPELRFSDASHHMGTTRMSQDPKKGVVDGDCKVHGLSNLFVAGSSVFPTGGHTSPTLGIVALSVRLAEKLQDFATRI